MSACQYQQESQFERMLAQRRQVSSSGNQQQLTDRRAAFEVAVRLNRVGERVLLVDMDLQAAVAHPGENLAGAADRLRTGTVVVRSSMIAEIDRAGAWLPIDRGCRT